MLADTGMEACTVLANSAGSDHSRAWGVLAGSVDPSSQTHVKRDGGRCRLRDRAAEFPPLLTCLHGCPFGLSFRRWGTCCGSEMRHFSHTAVTSSVSAKFPPCFSLTTKVQHCRLKWPLRQSPMPAAVATELWGILAGVYVVLGGCDWVQGFGCHQEGGDWL